MEVGSIVQKIVDKVEPFTEQVSFLMGAICGIGALLYIGFKLWKNMAAGEPPDVYVLLRPFVIGILVLNFSVVKDSIDFLVGRVERLSYGYFEKTFGSVTEQAQKVQAQVKQQAEQREAKEKADKEERLKGKNMFQRGLEHVKDGAEAVVGGVQGFLGALLGLLSTVVTAVLHALIYAIKTIITWYYQYVSIIYRCILGILGPLAFTVAIFPGFTNGIGNWLSKYIAICLWVPVFGIVNYLMVSVQTQLIASVDFSNWTTAGLALSVAEWQSIFLGVIEIAVYLTVPTIVSWIVPNGDTSGALGGMKAMFGAAAAVAGAAIGFAAGKKMPKKNERQNEK